MSTNLSTYRTNKIQDFIQDQLSAGVKSFDKLTTSEQEELALLCMQAEESNGDVLDKILIYCDSDDIIAPLMKYFISGDIDDGFDFLDSIKNIAIQAYSLDMDDLFDELRHENRIAEYEENGLTRIVDHVNGEVRWVKL